MVDKPFKALCTWAEVELNASEPVVWPLKVRVKLPEEPETDTICTSERFPNDPLAPEAGAVKVTCAPVTGPPDEVTVASSRVAKVVLTAVLCGVPLVGRIIGAGVAGRVAGAGAGMGDVAFAVSAVGR